MGCPPEILVRVVQRKYQQPSFDRHKMWHSGEAVSGAGLASAHEAKTAASVPPLHVARQAIPETAYAGGQVRPVTEGSDGTTSGKGQCYLDPAAPDHRHAAGLDNINEEIEVVAHAIITTEWRNLEKPETQRT
jgi:hypothetical protein